VGAIRMIRHLPHLSKVARARLGYAGGCLTAALGAGVEFGCGVGLMVAGVVMAASFLVLADVDEAKSGSR
jgi:hypothetical protein